MCSSLLNQKRVRFQNESMVDELQKKGFMFVATCTNSDDKPLFEDKIGKMAQERINEDTTTRKEMHDVLFSPGNSCKPEKANKLKMHNNFDKIKEQFCHPSKTKG